MGTTNKMKYNLYDKKTGDILAENVVKEDLKVLESALVDVGYTVSIKETAAGGSTGAGSIAVNMSGGSSNKKSLIKFMQDFNAKITNKFKPSDVKRPLFITVTENFDIESVFSRLSSMEKAGSTKKTEGTTFGIEDDSGNIMKVTVRSDQASDFETEIASHLSDIKRNVIGAPAPRGTTDVSIAELLFKLKDRFDIIDVEFPKIPTDVIYNADKASYSPVGDDTSRLGDEQDLGMGDDMNDPNAPLDLTDFEEPMDGEPGAEGDPQMGGDELEMGDDGSVEDFGMEDTENSEESILTQVISMLKAQAEAETERAKASAEQARADQARYTAQATRAEQRDQEESLRYEVEMEEQKKKEKEADRRAEMAKHKISKVMGMREADDMASVSSVQRERMNIQRMYMINPQDDQETKIYKAKQRGEAMREWASRLRQAQNKERFEAQRKQTQAQAQKPQPTTQQQQQQQQQQQGQQQQGQPNNGTMA